MPTNPLASILASLPTPVLTVAAPAPVATPTTLDFASLGVTLMPYQEEGVLYALAQHAKGLGAYIGDEMGLGKTFIGGTAFVLPRRFPALVVCPPSLTINWKREMLKLDPTLRVVILAGTKPTMPEQADIYVVGSSVVSKWAGLRKVERNGRKVDVVDGVLTMLGIQALCVDEAHHYKTHGAARTRSLVSLSKALPADAMRILMSGTPMPNRHQEMATQIEALGVASVFGGVYRFLNRYAPKIDAWGSRGSAHGEELFQVMRDNFMIRRMRDDVLALPNKGRSVVAMEMAGKAASQYKQAEHDLIAYLRGEYGDNRANSAAKAEALVLLNTLRRLSGASKIAAVIAYVEELLEDDAEQVFVAAVHRDVTEAVAAHFKAPTIVGGMTVEAKMAAVDAFQSKQARVIVGNIQAAGVGFTLTAGRHVVVAELPWTPGDLKQVEDRMARIGQTREVFSHVAIGVNGVRTVDERIFALLNDKASVVGTAIDGEAETLTDDSIMNAVLDSYRD